MTDRIKALEDALRKIRELNETGADENGHRWVNSDLIEQEIVFALAASQPAPALDVTGAAPDAHQTDLVAAGAQQEPVAWLHRWHDGNPAGIYEFKAHAPPGVVVTPLYAAPQPLTVQDAARVLLSDPDAVAKLARAYDREDSAQRGEADPHDGRLFPTDPEWEGERIACAKAALRAIAEGRA